MKTPWRALGALIPVLLFTLAAIVLKRELDAHNLADVVRELSAIPKGQIALAFLFTALNYSMLVLGYDVLGQIYAGKVLSKRKTWTTSLIAISFGNALGFNALTGGLIRLRLYLRYGLAPMHVAKIAAFGFLTFWAGLFVAGSYAFLFTPMRLPPHLAGRLPGPHTLGMILLLSGIAYIVICSVWPGRVLLTKLQVGVPTWRLGLGQMFFGTMEWLFGAAVLHALLPSHLVGYTQSLSVFIVSLVLGLASTVPGGLGVFESSALLLLGKTLGAPRVFGILLVYRIVYTLTPFILGLVTLGVLELRQKFWVLKPKAIEE